ncbi:MAG: ChbG/HpnK family deacetylase [Lachnospiraceae bacterium]|nr:ChbG/HpnK family deacetylase [Lachnospiraceae bacterium]
MALIINADDFGLNENVNSAIAEAFAKGLIDRTTLMANMPSAASAMQLAASEGFSDKVGLHINLTSGRPLTEKIACDPVMCRGGEFTAEFARNIKTRFFLPRRTCEAVEGELRAQLDAYRELGGTLWHIDSHHHVHTDPSIWLILKKVLKDYPVTSVRLGRNMYRGGNPLMHIYKSVLNRSIRRFCRTRPDLFGSASDHESYFAGRDTARDYEIEVMVHPVYDGEKKLADDTASLRELKRL